MNPNFQTWDDRSSSPIYYAYYPYACHESCQWENDSELKKIQKLHFDSMMSICFHDIKYMFDSLLCQPGCTETTIYNTTKYIVQMYYTLVHSTVIWHDLTVDCNEGKQLSCKLVFNEIYREYTAACLEDPVTLPSIPAELYTSIVYNSMVCLLYAVTAGFGSFHVEFMSRVLCSFNPAPHSPSSLRPHR